MKKTILILIFGFITSVNFGQTRHPYYGGGHHTSSHGGHYSGSSSGSSHRGGHYKNSNTYNTYGRHKRR